MQESVPKKFNLENGNITIRNVTELTGATMSVIGASKVSDSILPFTPLISEVSRMIQLEEDRKILSHDVKEMNKYIQDIEGGIASEISGINAKLDDITQWNIAWQKKLLSRNDDVIADATIPISEFYDPLEKVKRGRAY
ncbi:13425_t:CDS:2 [Funneliformis mosseae]|uniref:13425_t:CDS:1 n=1 Tax=Funneliformis mosseae TaxID=27381 RepID=A0A9N8W0B0_FUNMO|nr:13425_t:CDS:2 [Funneliformis mosseae]